MGKLILFVKSIRMLMTAAMILPGCPKDDGLARKVPAGAGQAEYQGGDE